MEFLVGTRPDSHQVVVQRRPSRAPASPNRKAAVQAAASVEPRRAAPRSQRTAARASGWASLCSISSGPAAPIPRTTTTSRGRAGNRLRRQRDAVTQRRLRTADSEHTPVDPGYADVGGDAVGRVEGIERDAERGGAGLVECHNVEAMLPFAPSLLSITTG
jgi:hypothetical protein